MSRQRVDSSILKYLKLLVVFQIKRTFETKDEVPCLLNALAEAGMASLEKKYSAFENAANQNG